MRSQYQNQVSCLVAKTTMCERGLSGSVDAPEQRFSTYYDVWSPSRHSQHQRPPAQQYMFFFVFHS